MKTILTAIILTILLSGCGLFQSKPSEERIVHKFISVPVEMTEPVVITPPPKPIFYSVLDWNKQEELLMLMLQDRMQQVGACNARLQAISIWSLKQSDIYNPVNP